MSENRLPDEDILLKQFGELLKAIRKQQGISQEDLAQKAGFSRSYYTEIETGKRNISLLNLYRLSDALGIPLAELLATGMNKPRTALDNGFIDHPSLETVGLSIAIIQNSLSYTYGILDAIDQTLQRHDVSRIAKIVELANLSSMVGNLLGTGIVKASQGYFQRNQPHSFPDLLGVHPQARDIEIKIALEDNKPKEHLAKAGYYLTYRYTLCDSAGRYSLERGDVVYVWEIRFGYLEQSHFNLSNTSGDSGKTAVINADGMAQLQVIYCDLERCPYSPKSRTYAYYKTLLGM